MTELCILTFSRWESVQEAVDQSSHCCVFKCEVVCAAAAEYLSLFPTFHFVMIFCLIAHSPPLSTASFSPVNCKRMLMDVCSDLLAWKRFISAAGKGVTSFWWRLWSPEQNVRSWQSFLCPSEVEPSIMDQRSNLYTLMTSTLQTTNYPRAKLSHMLTDSLLWPRQWNVVEPTAGSWAKHSCVFTYGLVSAAF